MDKLGQETRRACIQARAARMHGLRRTEISLAPNRREAVEFNLRNMGYRVAVSIDDPEMTVIKW